MSATTDLLSNYQHIIDELKLIPATGGVFEVDVDGKSIYSKIATDRHAEPGEILDLFTGLVGTDILRYGT